MNLIDLLIIIARERNCDVPLRNDHDLEIEMNGKLVSRARRTTVDMTPTGENAGRYSALSTSWGRLSNNDVLQTLTIGRADDDVVVSEAEDEDDCTAPEVYERHYCRLCEKLDVTRVEVSERRMRKHMRNG